MNRRPTGRGQRDPGAALRRLLVVTLCLSAAAGVQAAQTLRLIVRNGAGVALEDAPVTTGVPWPSGALASPHELRLLDPDGEEAPLQVAVLARWPGDGGVKWTLLDFQATVEADTPAVYKLQYGTGVHRARQVARALLVEEDETHVTVSSGAAVMKVRKSGFNVLDHVTLRGQGRPLVELSGDQRAGLVLVPSEEMASAKSPGHATAVRLAPTDRVFLGRHALGAGWLRRRGFRVADASTGEEIEGLGVVGASLDSEGKKKLVGHGWCEGAFLHLSRAPERPVVVHYPRAAAEPAPYRSCLGSSDVTVELRGPVRSVVRARGKFQAKDGSTLCDYEARLHFYAGKPWARLQLTVVNREPMPISRGLTIYPLLVNDLSVELPVRLRGLQRFVFGGSRRQGTTHRGELLKGRAEARLVQFASRRRTLDYYRVTHGSEGLATGRGSAGAVGLADTTRGVVAVVRRLREKNPKALRVEAGGAIEIGLFPAEAGPAEELLAGRARTHDVLLAFHGEERPAVLELCDQVNHPLIACAAPDDGKPYRGRWYADSGAFPLAPLADTDHDRLFGRDYRVLVGRQDHTGARGVWHDGAQGTEPCRVGSIVIDSADDYSVRSPGLLSVEEPRGMAMVVTSGRGVGAGRIEPLVVTAYDPETHRLSFVKALDPVPEKGARAALYDPHGTFLCHRYDPALALARESVRRCSPRVLAAARLRARHLADIGTYHGIRGGDPAWVGASHDPYLGRTAHHVPGLTPGASWYAGPWLTFLLTGDRVVLGSAFENATFAARRADEPGSSPLAAALAAINLNYAADVAGALATDDAPVYEAALEAYVEKLLAAQRRAPRGLYGDLSLAAGLALEALSQYHQRRQDERIPPAMLEAAEALIRPDAFWSGHNRVGHLRDRDGDLVKPYGTADGLVTNWARHPERSVYGPTCALVAPYLAAATEATGDGKYIKKARRLERVATLFRSGSSAEFALRYRCGDLFAARWQRYLQAHPLATDDAIAFQCRLENAADVAMPDLGKGGSVIYRPFVELKDGTRALQAQAPDIPAVAGVGVWFPLLGSGNVQQAEGTLEFRICYRQGPGRRENPWLLTGDPQRHGFAIGLKGDDLELLSRHGGRNLLRVVHRNATIETGRWHHVAFTWKPRWGVDLFLDGEKVGHSPRDRIGFAPRLRLPCYPDDPTNEYLIDDLRIWKTALDEFGAVADTQPPAPVTDLRLEPARDGKMLLSWTAPGDDGKEGQARRYDIRIHTLPFRPLSWGGYAHTRDPLAAIHWAEADRVVTAPRPQPAGRLEKLLIGPLPRRRRVYIAVRTEDEAHTSALSNVVSNAVNHPPVADPGLAVRQVVTGTAVTLDGRGSSDPDYDELTYAWSTGAEGPVAQMTCQKPGEQTVELTVSDGQAEAKA
ncbi:MAG: LamG-like jellyroll fold domain-containing protein, partial [bacterium]